MKNRLGIKSKPVPVKIVGNSTAGSVAPASDAKYAAQERKWKAEEALRTIQRAEEYKSDKALMKEVKTMAKEQVKALSKIK